MRMVSPHHTQASRVYHGSFFSLWLSNFHAHAHSLASSSLARVSWLIIRQLSAKALSYSAVETVFQHVSSSCDQLDVDHFLSCAATNRVKDLLKVSVMHADAHVTMVVLRSRYICLPSPSLCLCQFTAVFISICESIPASYSR